MDSDDLMWFLAAVDSFIDYKADANSPGFCGNGYNFWIIDDRNGKLYIFYRFHRFRPDWGWHSDDNKEIVL